MNTEEKGSVADSTEPRFLIIGRVGKPHGVRGEARVEILTELPERFTWLERVFVSLKEHDTAPRPVGVESVRFHKNQALVKFTGYDWRDQVTALRSHWLFVPEEEGIPLEEGEFYAYQLIGMDVHTDEDVYLGKIKEIMQTKANDVYIVKGPKGEVLLPETDEVVQEIDIESGRVIVHIIPGLLE